MEPEVRDSSVPEMPSEAQVMEHKEYSKNLTEDVRRAFQDGVLVLLSIGKKSWTLRLTPQMMGVEEFPPNWKPGRCQMLPAEALERIDKIEGAARRYLEGKSHSFGGVHSRHRLPFVHWKLVGQVLVRLDEFKVEYFSAVDDLIKSYESMKEQMRVEFPDQWPYLEKHYIPSEGIRQEYYFELTTREMALPSKFKIGDVREMDERAKHDESYRQKLASACQAQQKQAEVEIKEFVNQTFRSVRNMVIQVFQSFLTAREEGKELNKRSIDSLRNIIIKVDELEFLGDNSFRDQLTTIRETLDGAVDFKDNDSALQALNGMLKSTIDFANSTMDEEAQSISQRYFSRALEL